MSGIDVDIQTILDDLVHQFSDPMALFRELVQNAIDSGSGEVDVRLDFEEFDDAPSRAVITVQDWGEGMDRSIIENEFLRLFSSGKDQDLTKVGRFGIGFVSVFAIDPDEVVVDTGRSGEYWRLLFSNERSYELFSLDWPVEGTTIRIFRQMGRAEFEKLRNESRKALKKWCKHPEIPVYFQGEDIRRKFDVPSTFKLEHAQEGTRVIMGFTEDASGPTGYYNRGLTLQERPDSPWPWVTYKIDSRYLEHTLTRDQLLEDRHYSKARAMLEDLAEEQLPNLLIEQLEEVAGEPSQVDKYNRYCRYLAHYLSSDRVFRRSWRDRSIFRTVDGDVLSWNEAQKAIETKRLHRTRFAQMPGDLLGEDCHIVADGGGSRLIEEAFEATPGYLEERYLVARVLKLREEKSSRWLSRTVSQLLDAGGVRPEEVVMVPKNALPLELRDQMAVVVPSTFEGIVPAKRWERPGFEVSLEELNQRRILLVNTGVRLVENIISLGCTEPHWAAYALVESLFSSTDARLSAIAAAGRNRRWRGGEK